MASLSGPRSAVPGHRGRELERDTPVRRRSLCRTTACWRTGPGFGGDARELAWVDRTGKREGTVGAPAGTRIPGCRQTDNSWPCSSLKDGGDIWITDLERGASTRFTLDPASDNVPLWSPDGTRIAFVSNRDGGVFNIYQKNAGGTGPEELLLKTPRHKQLNDWSPDGQYLLYQEDDPQTKTDLWMLPLAGDRKPSRLLAHPVQRERGDVVSRRSLDRLHLRRKWQPPGVRAEVPHLGPEMASVSRKNRRAHPRWGPDGKELFFDAGGTMTAVSVTGLEPGSEFRPGAPKPLFRRAPELFPAQFRCRRHEDSASSCCWPGTSTTGAAAPITVVVNWKSGLSLAR